LLDLFVRGEIVNDLLSFRLDPIAYVVEKGRFPALVQVVCLVAIVDQILD
jgi:hypothetical protein